MGNLTSKDVSIPSTEKPIEKMLFTSMIAMAQSTREESIAAPIMGETENLTTT